MFFKGEELDNLNKAVSDLRGNSTGRTSCEKVSLHGGTSGRREISKMSEIDKLKVQIANKENEIVPSCRRSWKNCKMSWLPLMRNWQTKRQAPVADQQLDELNKDMEFVKADRDARQDAMQFSREAQTGAAHLSRQLCWKKHDHDYRSKMTSLPPEIKSPFDGSPLETIAEHTAEVLHCATLPYLGYIDQATTFAEGQGGGGGGSNDDMKWGQTMTRMTGVRAPLPYDGKTGWCDRRQQE